MNQLYLFVFLWSLQELPTETAALGRAKGIPEIAAVASASRDPVRVQALILFHASWTKWQICKNRKHIQKRGRYASVWSTCHTNKILRRTPVLKRFFETRIPKVERVGSGNENRTPSTQKCEKTLTLNRAALSMHKSRLRSRTFAIQVIKLSIFFTCLSLTNLFMAYM